MLRLCAILVGLTVLLAQGPPAVPLSTEAFAQDTASLDRRVTKLEQDVRKIDWHPGLGGLSFLFGVFCALWAQNTGRSAWLWFFLGAIFSVISAVALLVKNSEDRRREQRAR